MSKITYKNNNKIDKLLIGIFICIVIIAPISKLFLPDDREIYDANYEKPIVIGNKTIKVENMINNSKDKFIQFDVELINYEENQKSLNENQFEEYKIIDDNKDEYEVYYTDTIKTKLNSNKEEFKYLVRTYEIPYKKELEDIYYFSILYNLKENKFDVDEQKDYVDEITSIYVNMDYRLAKNENVKSIKPKAELGDSEEVKSFKEELKNKGTTPEGNIDEVNLNEIPTPASTADDNPNETETLTNKEINEINKTNKEEKTAENKELIKEYQDKINGLNKTMKDLNMQGDDKEKTQEVIDSYKEEIQKLEEENNRINEK